MKWRNKWIRELWRIEKFVDCVQNSSVNILVCWGWSAIWKCFCALVPVTYSVAWKTTKNSSNYEGIFAPLLTCSSACAIYKSYLWTVSTGVYEKWPICACMCKLTKNNVFGVRFLFTSFRYSYVCDFDICVFVFFSSHITKLLKLDGQPSLVWNFGVVIFYFLNSD